MEFLVPGTLARLLGAGARQVETPAGVGLLVHLWGLAPVRQ
ncbi:hypothetical protein AADR41_03800 [Streptomyces sp. CLV115]